MTGMGKEVEMSERDFAKLRAIIHKTTGITIGDTRRSMLVSRLKGRLREVELDSFDAYINRVSKDPDEMQELTNRVTTNETYFYRTPRVWEYFRNEVLPAFHDSSQKRSLRVWSAAASTGEEAHTIAALLEEERAAKPGAFDYTILGTDVSSRVLKVAETGLYKGRSVARFQKAEPEIFARQLRGSEEAGFKVTAQAKARLKFRLHNLLENLKNTGAFDVVFLRNVLIYFTKEDQERILQNVYDHMRPEGVLFIGESETLTNLNTPFTSVAPLVYQPVVGQPK